MDVVVVIFPNSQCTKVNMAVDDPICKMQVPEVGCCVQNPEIWLVSENWSNKICAPFYVPSVCVISYCTFFSDNFFLLFYFIA